MKIFLVIISVLLFLALVAINNNLRDISSLLDNINSNVSNINHNIYIMGQSIKN